MNARARTLVAPVWLALALTMLGVTPSPAPSTSPIPMRHNMRDARYCEILIVHRQGMVLAANVYNTLGLGNCPEALWKKLDKSAIRKQYGGIDVFLNGPRAFVMDEAGLSKVGPTQMFGGIPARLFAVVDVKPISLLTDKPYVDRTVMRDSSYVYLPGRPVFELHAPGGKTYIMQAYSMIVDPTMNYSRLAHLQDTLKLPSGYTYTMRVPASTIVSNAIDGKATIIQDDLEDTYQLEQR